MLRPMGRSEAETELEREGNCAHSPLLRPSQDNSDLVVEQCGLGEVRPHLQGVSIPTLPVVDLGTEHAAHEALARPRIEETHAIVAHEDTMIAEWISLTEEGDELESGVRVADDDPSDLTQMRGKLRAFFFGPRIDSRLHCYRCHDSASSIAVGAGPTVWLSGSGGTFQGAF